MIPTDLSGRRTAVLGAARSGMAAAALLRRSGLDVFVSERGAIAPEAARQFADLGIAFESGGHSEAVSEADFLVISPGVPSDAEPVKQAAERHIPVYSEIEVASWFCRAPILAVTGSNGKTTTTSLIGDIVRRAGRHTVVAGNIGIPFSSVVEELTPESVAVLEVSSFQLDHIHRFRPHVAVLLNITPDHLDRYGAFDRYIASKLRIAMNQRESDALVYSHDDTVTREAVQALPADRRLRTLAFSSEEELDEGAFVRHETLTLRLNSQEETLMQAEQLALQGRHNLRNALAAALATRVLEIRSDVIRESLMGFEGVAHRLEFVREIDGVRYVNDSKATNVNAVWFALESFRRPVILIAGGRDKGNDYTSLLPLVRSRVKAVIGIGESGDRVVRELGAEAGRSERVFTMEEAVKVARALGRPGDVVLLSPACASFDMFTNFEDRGETFKRLVDSL